MTNALNVINVLNTNFKKQTKDKLGFWHVE